ncbi:Hypothetical Protein FCC1311_019352 [Hondaea fermentalgiana]|uniref:TIR domain-containing protein n=1 Tax=Hondaea fermentalgiana TaxID=2315210 RepID=A0A2R5G3U4_9STRA|nr:Hypothetical Protein FCC1311_019352 [Hondaea fermentalgiana]|eukprot:GBG25716.1 Hypothetical Protein FCC1311_019352 [Hondaea fermentalgiana]
MLKYMHELGVLVHLTTGQNDALRQIVVIRPQWLLDTLSRVICDPDVGHMREHKKKLLYHTNDGNEEELPVELEDALDEWADRGVASRDLLEWLWQREPIDYLTALMNSMLLACPSPWIGNGDEEGALLIPSLLRGVDDATREEALRGLGDQRALAYIEFAVLPQGVFQRLIASIVQSLPVAIAVGRHGVFSDFASMEFDGVGVVLETSRNRVMLYFERPAERSLTNHVSILKRSLESINSSFMKGNLDPELYVSSDGTDRDTACASVRAIDQAIDQAASDVTSRGLRMLPLTSFALFIESSEAAKFLLSSDKPFDVFLSHAWGKGKETHRKVKAVADALEGRGIKCWFDGSNIGLDVLKSMADGIDQSKAVVVFVTQTYMDNVNKDRTIPDNCRTEFYHALHTHGPANMIPCVLEPGLDSTHSWTGVFRAGWSGEPLFVRMLNGAESSSEVDDLVWAIQKVLDSQEDAARCS